MDAIKFLLTEHKKIRKTFLKIKKTTACATKKKIFDIFCKELDRHEQMEQKIWYPYLKKYANLKTKINHLMKEEKKAARTIKIMQRLKTPKKWEEKFLTFKKDVSHHAKEEETKLFPSVKKTLEKTELAMLGKKFGEFKNKRIKHFL